MVIRNDAGTVSSRLFYTSGCAGEKCVADLKVSSEPLTVVDPYILGSTKVIAIEYTVTNLQELAYLPQMRVTKSAQLKFAKIPSNCHTKDESLLCDITRPNLAAGTSKSIQINFDTSSMDNSDVRISAEVFSSSEEANPNDNIVTNVVTVAEFSEIESSGVSSPRTVQLDMMGDTVNISHLINVRNDGPSTIKSLNIVLDIPTFHEADYEIARELIKVNKINARATYINNDLPLTWSQNDRILIQNPTERVMPAIPDELDALRFDNYKLGQPEMDLQDPQTLCKSGLVSIVPNHN